VKGTDSDGSQALKNLLCDDRAWGDALSRAGADSVFGFVQ